MNSARLLAGVFVFSLLAGCSTPQTRLLLQSPPESLPRHSEIAAVPFFQQDEFQCGPASLAMTLGHAGLDINPLQLKDALYIPDKQGSLQIEMLAATRRQGYMSYLLRPSLQDVLTEVSSGHPVIVLQNLSLDWFPIWHYAVVVGYDLDNKSIILRSGNTPRLEMSMSTFENTWARSKHWAMLALKPGQIPITAIPENYIQSLNALSHTSKTTDTGPSHAAALQRWPGNLAVAIAAGNFAYHSGELTQAEQIFMEAARVHPDSAAALNNLAQTQSDLGKLDAALETIRKALKLGGSLTRTLQATESEIEQKKREAKGGAVQ